LASWRSTNHFAVVVGSAVPAQVSQAEGVGGWELCVGLVLMQAASAVYVMTYLFVWCFQALQHLVLSSVWCY